MNAIDGTKKHWNIRGIPSGDFFCKSSHSYRGYGNEQNGIPLRIQEQMPFMKTIIQNFVLIVILVCSFSALNAQNGLHLMATIIGEEIGDRVGGVEWVGDVNGDGFDDVLINTIRGSWTYYSLYHGGAPLFNRMFSYQILSQPHKTLAPIVKLFIMAIISKQRTPYKRCYADPYKMP
jgi:hypothetical protein